jgi:H+/Cl- antiporter ClcA
MADIALPMPDSLVGADSQTKQKRGDNHWTPTTKVGIGALAGAATILLSPFLKLYWRAWTQSDITPEVTAAITTLLTFAIQYLVPDRKG